MSIDLPELMSLQGGALTARQAAEFGVRGDEILSRVRRRELKIVRRGVYTTMALWEGSDAAERHRIEVAAALLARGWTALASAPPSLAAGFESARTLWRLPGLEVRRETAPEARARTANASTVALVSATRCQRAYRGRVHVHPASLPEQHLAAIGGIPVTSLARTAVDLSREGRWWDAVIVGDAVLRANVDPAELRRVAEYCACWPGGRQAMRMAKFADAKAESPAESIARAVCADHGLPAPELQVELRGRCGRLFRIDQYFRRFRTLLEIDGRVKYRDAHRDPADVLWAEKQREDSLRDAGNEVVRATYTQLTTQPAEVVARIKEAFARSLRHAG